LPSPGTIREVSQISDTVHTSRKEGDSVAGKKERQRRLAREHYARQQARRIQRAHRWRLIGIIVASCCAVVLLGGGGYFAFGGGGGKPAAATPAPTPAATAPAPTASPTPSLAAEPAAHCIYTPNGTAARKAGVPPAKPGYRASRYRAAIKTNRGTIVLDLLNHQATCTVNSFIYLAAKSYFNNTPCHRLTTSGIYVLQCGDPTGTGSGGPGYKFADENLAGAKYTEGTVAMANSGPGTNGSQFFLVYRNSLTLPANYTPFGKIVSGLGIIQNVAKAGTDNSNGNGDGHPKEKVTIESVTITKA
jgi:peptidyl-prolyl cis-trans isomerase B (cyclophilin B)